jgi:hypothetical protein
MAILCTEYDLVFAHVPKTGGAFVEHMLVEHLGGVKVGGRHDTFRRLSLRRFPPIRAFSVREPLSWYRSYWGFQRQISKRASAWPTWDNGAGSHPTADLDRTCGSPTFEDFVLRAIDQFPNGFVRSMYCRYLNGATHVLRTSCLTEDLEALLRVVSFDRPSLARDQPRRNETSKVWRTRAALSEDTELRLREIDCVDGLRFPYMSTEVPERRIKRWPRRRA